MDNPVAEFKAWFGKLPAFSRTFITATFVLVVLNSFGIISPYSLFYDFEATFKKAQVLPPSLSSGGQSPASSSLENSLSTI